jgi:integrase
MGVIVRQKKGDRAWWVFINHKGRRKAKRIGDRQTAEAVSKRIRQRLASGDLGLLADDNEASTHTVADYATPWYTVTTPLRCKPSTVQFYETNVKQHVLPIIGSKPIGTISKEDCRAIIAACAEKGLRRGTIRNVCRTLSALLTDAVDDGLLAANPALRLDKYYKNVDETDPRINPLTVEEARVFLDTAREYVPREYPLFLCALSTGLRLGELLGLHWSDIDKDSRFIVVSRSRVRGVESSPKSGKSRQVDLSRTLADELWALRRDRQKEALKQGWGSLPDHVFCNRHGKPLDAPNIRRVFHRVLKKAKLRRVRFHDLRHSYCSTLLQMGESIVYVKDQLGHSSIQLTVDTYGHLVPGYNRQAANRLADGLVRNLSATNDASGTDKRA